MKNFRLLRAKQWLQQNENRIRNRPDLYPNGFDFPLYFDMPDSLAHKLTPDEVDELQKYTADWIS